MRFGLGYGIDVQRRQDPLRSLFSAGEQGFVYDLYDAGTIFQDAAGTTPWTTLGQPVGLVLDKRLGLVLGSELVVNGGFSSATGWTLTAGAGIVGGELSVTAAAAATFATNTGQTTAGKWYRVSLTITTQTIAGNGISPGAGIIPANAVSGVGTYTWTILATSTAAITLIKRGGAGWEGVIDNFTVRELPGNHAYQTTPTARPVLDVSAQGYRRLKFDGTDDFLVTNSINFTGTDKMTGWAGVRKLSDAASASVVELSANTGLNNGAFVVYAPLTAAANFSFGTRGTSAGTISANTPSSYPSPTTNVITGIGDISGDISRIRVNGATVATNTTDQGTGNYGNYPLYIGSRGGTSLPFNGELYSPIVVRGAASSDGQIRMVETLINGNMGGGFL